MQEGSGEFKLKVLFVLHYPNPFPGASWTRISFFAQFLKDKGHQVSINGAFSLKTLKKFGIINWHGLKLYNLTAIILLNNIFSLMFNILSSVLTTFLMIIFNRPDVIVISVPMGDTALGSCFVSSLLRKKIIIDYRDEWEDFLINNAKSENYRRLYKSLKKRITKFYLQSNHVITPTENLVKNLSKRGLRNVKLIANGADIKIFKPYDKVKLRQMMGFDENDFIFVYSGGIATYYRVDLVIKSIGKMIQRKCNVKLLLVGPISNVNEIKNLIKKQGLQNNISSLGEITEKIHLAKIISASDVGIIPYDANPLWKNSIPTKALEYFACGLPAIASVYQDSLLGKLISENEIGLISEPENVDALTNSFEKIFRDKLFVKKAQERAYKLIRERFDRNKTAIEFLNLLEG